MIQLFQFRFDHRTLYVGAALILSIIGMVIAVDLLAEGTQSGPDLNVSVARFEPQGEIDPATNITVKFSRDMVPKDSLDQPVLDPPLEFDPPVSGVARWIEQDILRFYPDNELNPASEYKIRVKSKKTYYNGNRINEKRTFRLVTGPLTIISMDYHPLYAPDIPGRVRLGINLWFNYRVDLEQLKMKLGIDGGEGSSKNHLAFTISDYSMDMTETEVEEARRTYAANVTIETEELEVTDRRQEYILTIASGLPCFTCGQGLETEYRQSLYLESKKRLIVKSARPLIEGKKGGIQIFLSDGINDETVRSFISVSPEFDFTARANRNWMQLSGDFEPGRTYTVTLSEGLPSISGSFLETKFSSIITIPDLPPSIEFTSPGMYLPRQGAGLLEVETINVDTLLVEVEQVFVNNILYALSSGYGFSGGYYNRANLSILGKNFFSIDKTLEGELNQPIRTTIDIGGIIPDTVRGIFKVSARIKSNRWRQDSRLVMKTDIGLMARQSDNYLMVWANSLSETAPLAKASVTLMSRNNQVLLTGQTDSRGLVVFNDIAEKIEGYDPYLIIVTYNGDLCFLKFDDCLLPTSDFDVRGRPELVSGYESFIYLDRGVYRPGDTAHIVSLVRGVGGTVPDEFPYFINITEPGGRDFQSFRVSTGGSSMTAVDLEIPDFARTGVYRAVARIGEDMEIGRTSFQVEEFMPDRIKTTVTTPEKEYQAGRTVPIDVTGKFLFGPAAAGHNVSAHITIEAQPFAPAGYEDYTFDDYNVEFSRVEIDLPENHLDDSGYYTFKSSIPEGYRPGSALKGLISATVSEQGGRAVSAYTDITIHPYPRYLGIRKDFESFVKPGDSCRFSLAIINSDGTATSLAETDINFYRVVYNSILRKDDNGRYRYISERKLIIQDSLRQALPDSGLSAWFVPPQNGSYLIEAVDCKGGHKAAVLFYASGWGYAPWSMDKPDRIEIDLDRKSYPPGDNAIVQIRSPFGGKLLVTIEKDRVIEFITYDMAENTAEINIPVRKDFFPNAYITATVIKKAGEIDPMSPSRAFGVAPIMLDMTEMGLKVSITAPEVIKPRNDLKIELQVARPGRTKVTVAAVDAGILQLTDYRTPDPLEFFYGKRKLSLRPYDIYSFIYPEIERAASHLSPSGGVDLFEAARKRHLNPITARRVKPVALWSGIVETDESGRAVVNFGIPEFNGKLVIMALAVRENLYGSVTDEIIVRDNIVLQESFPRFISPNDEFDGLITLFNNSGWTADISVQLDCQGPIGIISPAVQNVSLSSNSEGRVVFRLKAGLTPGLIKCRVHAADGLEHSEINFELANRPTQPLVTRFGSGAINQEMTASFVLPDEWIAETGQYSIHTSSLAAAQFTRNINYLVQYPYGCLEQTTSGLFPLLYFNDLARFVQPEVFSTGGPDYFIREGLIKLKGMMRPDGLFSFWPGDGPVNHWASIYASHFILEADKAGFYVDPKIRRKLISNLKIYTRGQRFPGDEIGIPCRIYAAYVLAQAGEIDKKAVNYVRGLPTQDLTVDSRFQLAGVLALADDRETAASLLPTNIQPENYEPETGGNFCSGVRSTAILLEVLNTIDPENPSCAVLAKDLIEKARLGRWYTTQETAYALMALGKYLRGREESNFTGTLEIAGDSSYSFGTDDFKLERKDPGGKAVNIDISGAGTCFYYWQASGVPVSNAPDEFTRGITVNREYLGADGTPLDLKAVEIGTQVIAHIRVEAVDRDLDNVVINDLLPAGLEIENPRLITTPRMNWIPRSDLKIDYQDIRDDRLLIFAHLWPKRPLDIYYSLRAIAIGEFKIPPVAAECMYNPVIAGSASSGILNIIERKEP
nr:alpha-2-macroglobulin family protein [candidate division Zixibacteria bacterium]